MSDAIPNVAAIVALMNETRRTVCKRQHGLAVLISTWRAMMYQLFAYLNSEMRLGNCGTELPA